jgi:hypothetical protein
MTANCRSDDEMKNKYHAKKVTFNGITYDSKKEARRHLLLLDMEKKGEITDLQRQVKFDLIPAQREPNTIGSRGGVKQGKLLEREVAYIADFVYYADGERIVEDTKGVRTKEYIIKRKLMLWVHGIRVAEV